MGQPLCLCGCGEPAATPWSNRVYRFASCGCAARHEARKRHARHLESYKVEERGHNSPCWIWTGCIGHGYGAVTRNGTRIYAHRLFYEHHVGPIPPDQELDHLCRNSSCVNPAHLEPVSHTVNVRRGRSVKLDVHRVAEIRRRRAAGETTITIGAEFDIHPSHVSRICNREIWR